MDTRTYPHGMRSLAAVEALARVVRAADSPMNALCELLVRVARADLPVLLVGESGTGKELLARVVHLASPRAERPFVGENCAALPDELLESELFGHKRGAFTGAYEDRVGLLAQADGGTIFLDEVAETSPAFQAKLLRALQEGEIRPVGSGRRLSVDVRVVAATNRDLEQAVRAGTFREDLYYRLAGVAVRVPPLRERPMDVLPIAQSILAAATRGGRTAAFAPATLACLQRYRWPGNVRELQNEVQRMLALSEDGPLAPDALSPRVVQAAGDEREERDLAFVGTLSGTLKSRLEQLEGLLLRECLVRHRGNKTHAARELGLSRVGLRSKLARLGIERIESLPASRRGGPTAGDPGEA